MVFFIGSVADSWRINITLYILYTSFVTYAIHDTKRSRAWTSAVDISGTNHKNRRGETGAKLSKAGMTHWQPAQAVANIALP